MGIEPVKNLVIKLLEGNMGEKTIAIIPLQGGANSTVYRLQTENNIYLAKRYIKRPHDSRDRFRTEFEGLSFLWRNGLRNIPEPICSDSDNNIAIYRFIPGEKIKTEEISKDDVILAADFINSMHEMNSAPGATLQPVASEACFSMQAYMECMDERLERLLSIDSGAAEFKNLNQFLINDINPFYDRIRNFVKDEAGRLDYDMSRQLKRSRMILSQSDFGFHNAIKSVNGSLYFLDFEYYGWDDPAKLISDFYLQPEIPLPVKYRELFFERVYGILGEDNNLQKRLPMVFLILSLKWSLIILNIFTRTGDSDYDNETYGTQLQKARDKLAESLREFESRTFPFSLSI